MPRTPTKGEGKRHPLGLRTTLELRRALEKAAARSGRSLAQEIEHRLEESLDLEKRSYMYIGFGGWRSPLIPHKGELVLVLHGARTITLSLSEADLATLLAELDSAR